MAANTAYMKAFSQFHYRLLHRGVFSGPVKHQINNCNKISKYGRPKLALSVIPEIGKSVIPSVPILFLHGMFGSRSNWKSIGKAVSKKTGRKVVSFDARNHGESENHISMSYEAMAFDTLKVLESLDIKRCVIVGHSMGGKTAMCLALGYPAVVDRLVVVDSAPKTSIAAGAAVTCLKAMMQLNVKDIKSYKEANEMLVNDIKDDSIRNFILTNLRISNGSSRWILNLRNFDKNLDSLLGFPEFLATQYIGNTLFLAGGNSDYITNAEIPEIIRLFPNAKIDRVENAGHWVHSDQPSVFVNKVCQFLS